MKKSKFTEEQIGFALHQAETGVSIEEVCRKIGVSQATFYVWKKKYAGLGVSELRSEGCPVRLEDEARLSPFGHQHINMLGRYSFSVPEVVARGELRPLGKVKDD